ncbi:MAG TPA: asparagine synthase-related protein [Victivallales bacterium]|nr:asparagine synthase-related protein [Victivallales bacterium]
MEDIRKIVRESDVEYFWFMVDDLIYMDHFSVKQIESYLDAQQDIDSFCLRLGRNITTKGRQPDFIREEGGFLVWDTQQDQGKHWNYFWEISSSIYRKNIVVEYLSKCRPDKPCSSVVEDEKAVVIVLGAPIYDDIRVDAEKSAKALLDEFSPRIVLEMLDGEFLAVRFDKRDSSLKIINDRWCSVQLHYHLASESKIFSASPYFHSLWLFMKDNGMLKLNQEAFFEMLWLQRLLGTKTLAKDAYFMPDAHVLSLEKWNIRLERYWNRNYKKNKNPLESNAQILAEMLRFSVTVKTADKENFGHFLSGGMDSRCVLGAFNEKLPTCFTVGLSDNREVKTAKKLAESRGAKHIFLLLNKEHYGMIRNAAVKICGGMFNYDHALFLGYEDAVIKEADVCFNGYGMDFMFQGMYIPGVNMKAFGRNLNYCRMIELPDDIAAFFIANASYRIKNADLWKFVKESHRQNLREFQRNSVEEILKRGKELTDNKFDLWEYITFHHLSRHYSFPNVLSIRSFVEARVASFTNEIFDHYLSLPVEQRFDGKIEKRLLQILSPALAAIPSANTGMPVTAGMFERTFRQIFNTAKRRILAEKDFESWMERTWPSREYALRKQNSLKSAVMELIQSDIFDQLEFLDIKKIKNDFPNWLMGENITGVSGDLVQTITTIGTFLNV